MNYLVAAYAVLWAVSFGLVFGMAWRQRKLRDQLALLSELTQEKLRSEQ